MKNNLRTIASGILATSQDVMHLSDNSNTISSVTVALEQFSKIKNSIEDMSKVIFDMDLSGKNLTKSKDNILEVITNLSAISEENAASTQQTSAATEQLSATIQEMSRMSDDLTQMSNLLMDYIRKFKI
jgi:methyl-accepting chemotaxis protein